MADTKQEAQQQDQVMLKLWMLRWARQKGGRGRKHVGVFVPNIPYTNTRPTGGTKCLGTLYQAVGSPFTGFIREIHRNWNSADVASLESSFLLCCIDAQHVWEPPTEEYIEQDDNRRSGLDHCALMAQLPGTTSRPWSPEEVMDCQDWIVSFLQRAVQRRIISTSDLESLYAVMEPKVALMTDPNARRVPMPNTEILSSMTNSVIQPPVALRHTRRSGQPHEQRQPQS